MTDVWGNFSEGVPQYAMEAFSAIDPWLYPIVLFGIIGYIYGCMQSVTSAIIAILITLGIFSVTTSIFEEVPEMTQILYIITILGLTMLLVSLLLHKRRVV